MFVWDANNLRKAPVKISFHASGQRHVQIGRGRRQLVHRREPPTLVVREQNLFVTGFDNFAKLLPLKGEAFDAMETIDLTAFPADCLPFVEVTVGNSFAAAASVQEPGYVEMVIRETIVRETPPGICIRVKYLAAG